MVWIEFRHSPAKWFAPLVALVIGMVAYLRYDQWYGVWSETSMVVQLGIAVSLPLVSAAAGLASLQRARAGMEEQFRSAARDPWLRELAVVTATLLWVVLPMVGLTIAMSIISAPEADSGGPWPGFLVNALIMCVLATAYGHLIARLLPSPFSVATAGFSAAIVVFIVGTESPWALFSLNGYPTHSFSPAALGARLALAGGLMLLAVGAGAIRDWSRMRGTSTPPVWSLCAASVAVALVAIPLAGPLQVERFARGQEVCTETYPRACLWPEHRRYLPTAAEYVGRFNELSEFFILPDDPHRGKDAFYERGIRGEVGDQISLRGGGYGIASGMISYAVAQTDFPGCDVGAEDYSPELDQAYWELFDWFTAYLMGVESLAQDGARGLSSVEVVRALPRHEQFGWAREQVAKLQAPCDA